MEIIVDGRKRKAKAVKGVDALISALGMNNCEALVKVNGKLSCDGAAISPKDIVEVIHYRPKNENAAKESNAAAKKIPSACSKCGKPAAISLRYAHLQLCQSHFAEFFEGRVKRTVREYGMLKKGEKIAVALSGGKDSCVMLRMLHKISKSLPIELFAITVDAGIHGYMEFGLETAKQECKKLGIPLHVVSFKEEFGSTLDELLRKKGEERSCSYCGVMRRYLLNKYARKLGANKIAVGHNADDVAQTVLMNFMRNEPERLARFGPVGGIVEDEMFITRIKPLFTTPERDVAAYTVMKEVPIKFMECPYAKNAFRQHVRKMLNDAEEKYPATKVRVVRAFLSTLKRGNGGEKVASTSSSARRDPFLHSAKSGPICKCIVCGEPTSQEVCSLCKMLEKA